MDTRNNNFLLLCCVVTVILGQSTPSSASCVFGQDCLFPCRCNSGECNQDTGQCDGSKCGDGYPRPTDEEGRFSWGGPGCQIGNVAYNKSTDQTGDWKGYLSDNGVDGRLSVSGSNPNNHCAHPDNDNEKAAWFYVDLGSVHKIFNVTVFNVLDDSGAKRMTEFSIRVGNTSNINQHTRCAYRSEIVQRGGSITLGCDEIARYVSFLREGGDDIDLVTICEFVVIGHPQRTGDCPAGKTGTFCLDDCENGSYGTNCSEKCGQCKNGLCQPKDGKCSDGCQLRFTGDLCKEELHSSPTGMIAGVVVAVVVVIVLAVVIGIIYTRRNKTGFFKSNDSPETKAKYKKAKGKPTIDVLWPDDKDSEAGDGHINPAVEPVFEAKDVEREEDFKGTLLTPDELEAYVIKKKSTALGFKTEFMKLPNETYAESEAGSKPENKVKNRFGNIKPFDTTRVTLKSDDMSKSDYINANYISGYKDIHNHYIATQGPKPSSLIDFWRLIWQKDVNRVVMVTRLSEMGKKKCEEYWPQDVGSTKAVGNLTVLHILEEEYGDYAYRKFRVTCKEEEREVHHFHFLSWIDKSRPDNTFRLLAFLRRVRSFDSEALGPLVVHCSAGVGRTGTLIALDYLMEQAKAEQKVAVFSCVQKLREQRMHMVQLVEQYVFVYDALLEALKSGDTVIPCATFPHTLEDLKRSDSAAHQQMRKEFELIRDYKEAIDLSKVDGGTAANKAKNRYQDIVPMDLFRPHLDLSFCENDYINAVFVDGYKSRDAYLLTQMPLPETVSDFLHMIYNLYEMRSNAIVMLNELDEDDLTCATYWPTEVDSPVKIGGLTVSLVSEDKEQHPNIIIRDLDISTFEGVDEQPHRVRQFQLTNCWSKGSLFPKEIGVLLDLMELVTRWQQQSEVTPVTVHCLNGVERSAMFAMASYLVDMLKVEQIVDVYLACRFITSKCPLALPSLEQYQFLFELAGSFMSNFETYANFK